MHRLVPLILLALPSPAIGQEFAPPDKGLRAIRIDTDPRESFLAVRADTMGRLFVGGREALFVYEPDSRGGYRPRQLLYRFPADTWVYDVEVRGDDLYVLTISALYVIPGGAVKRTDLRPRKLVWGIPMGHVHQCFHALAWGPEGDLYLSLGDPLWYYGDFSRPDHWGYWTFFSQPQGTKTPYHGVGGVLRCRPDGSGLQVVARGLRNACGLCFDRYWNLFTNDNDHESMPELYVPGRLLHVVPHADFAWPRGWMPAKTPDRSDLLEPMFDGMGRAVPVLQAYYDDTRLPEAYRNNLLVARWGIRAVTRYPIEPRGASFRATAEHVLLQGQANARPVGVSVGRGGRVFVTLAHMAHNETSPIYRSDLVLITTADDAADLPFDAYDGTQAPAARLWAELSDPSWQRRYRAHVEILRRGGALLREANERLSECPGNAPALHHLIWLAAASKQRSVALVARTGDGDPRVRAQAVRALAEFPENLAEQPVFAQLLLDPDAQVRLAAVLAFHSPGVRWLDAARREIERGPARSADTYLRQAATRLLADKATVAQLEDLCAEDDAPGRLAGVLAAGMRLTIPRATAPLAADLPLAKLREEPANFAYLADGKLDLRTLGRIGNYTIAEHWRAGKHTAEQDRLFALLRKMLADPNEPVRLQAAYYLRLLNDPRGEPDVARVYTATEARRLAIAPLHGIDAVWAVGPFPDGPTGFKAVHPPEQGPIDLAARYPAGDKEPPLCWKQVRRDYLLPLDKALGSRAEASSYAYCRLDSATRQKAHLLIGSDDGVKVWHNGKEVWSKDATRSVLPFQDLVPLELEAGGNDLLLRVHSRSGKAGLILHYRSLAPVAARLPEKIDGVPLAQRLKDAGKDQPIGPEFLAVDWPAAAKEGDAKHGRQLFDALACAKCHARSASAAVTGGPSLADARRRFTVAYLVESILLPSKQISPIFRATRLETTAGQVLTGLVVGETAEKLELLLPDGTRRALGAKEIAERRLVEQSPMPAGLVRRPEELRDLLAYLLSDEP